MLARADQLSARLAARIARDAPGFAERLAEQQRLLADAKREVAELDPLLEQ